ncbi:hypothetical protein ACFVAJ_18930 [Agromyces sp. NPDC057679]|uniref:hypothetical protein n=1 Tax=Agromyces sp. NPDC057679 TaxID=3346207 RepID=UPI003671BA7D
MGSSAAIIVPVDEQVQSPEQAIAVALEQIAAGADVTVIPADSHVTRKNSRFTVELPEAKAVKFAGGDEQVKAEVIAAVKEKFAGKTVEVDTIEFAPVKLRRATSVAATGKATKTFAVYEPGVAKPVADGFAKATEAKRAAVELVNSGETSYTDLRIRAVVGKDGNSDLVKVARPVDADRVVKVVGTVDVVSVKAKAPAKAYQFALAA